ncbi:STAS domain-containing protein [Rhodanobacter sp. C01]|uniref:STAS domain-containing protein n=1 Tax=Rhodanobacter sp. C01 TaxID=1945856 RepID=UPI0020C2D65D|nr:STAS domain-containing protein [Rhodanobacter sp. C01]
MNDAPATLGVAGLLDFETAAPALQAIRSALAASQSTRLDLAGVSRCDSAGLACVVAAVAEAARHGRKLQVIHMPADMQALASVCEVDQLIG